MFPEHLVKEIENLFRNYPTKRPALIMALHAVQKEFGHLSPESFEELGEMFDEHPAEIESVATFYTMFHFEPVGKCLIEVCTNASCMIMGSDNIVAHIEKKLEIKMGETTSDGMFTVKEAECLAACDMAPMMIIGEDYIGPLTVEKVDKIIDEWRAANGG
ncbi:MAG TPA: NADH-quinone oxidoreductase subunit NuoE [bacterium]|jgi:NADH-quinone oxidoreductase subunit E